MRIKLKKGQEPFRMDIVVKDGVNLTEEQYKAVKDKVDKVVKTEEKK